MKINNKKNNKPEVSGINIDKIKAFCKKNVRYISAGALTVILVVVLAVTVTNGNGDKKDQEQEQEQIENQIQEPADNTVTEEYAVDANPEINNLINTYYNAYTLGDVNSIVAIASPVSDMEKSYIQFMSQYIESYQNIVCYTKKGLDDTSYMVSVKFDMKYTGVDGTLPGLDFFYVRTNEAGALYIDNLYGSFNSELKELETDQAISALVEQFKSDEDVKALQEEVQNQYKQVLESDVNLQNTVNTVTAGIQQWVSSYAAVDPTQTAENTQPEAPVEETPTDTPETPEETPTEAPEETPTDTPEETPADTPTDTPADTNSNSNGLNYVPEGTVLTATDAYNVRTSMDENSERIGTVAIGDSIKVILSYAEGWTKVEWNGKTGYIRTDLLLSN